MTLQTTAKYMAHESCDHERDQNEPSDDREAKNAVASASLNTAEEVDRGLSSKALLGITLAMTSNKPRNKREPSQLRKAPQAPKRFKSSYICFFMAKQQEIKDQLGEGSTVTDVSKRSANMWRNLSAEDRANWDDVAAKDKHRYMREKEAYTGPWHVPWKRARKDPSAPKRPMSAFLYFSQERRRIIKERNPGMRNTDVSRVLGEMWRNATETEREPHIRHELNEREKYKIEIAEWKRNNDIKKEEQRKADEKAAQLNGNSLHPSPFHEQSQAQTVALQQQQGFVDSEQRNAQHVHHQMQNSQLAAYDPMTGAPTFMISPQQVAAVPASQMQYYGLPAYRQYVLPAQGGRAVPAVAGTTAKHQHVILGPSGMPMVSNSSPLPKSMDQNGTSNQILASATTIATTNSIGAHVMQQRQSQTTNQDSANNLIYQQQAFLQQQLCADNQLNK